MLSSIRYYRVSCQRKIPHRVTLFPSVRVECGRRFCAVRSTTILECGDVCSTRRNESWCSGLNTPGLWSRDVSAKHVTSNETEQPECLDCHSFFCFCRRAYVLHQHRAGIPGHHKNKMRARAMPPAFAENSLVTMHLFNSACSKTAQNSVRHARKFLRAMACSVSFSRSHRIGMHSPASIRQLNG